MTPSGPALYLLGSIDLRGIPDEQGDDLLAQSKVVGLLACLALSPVGSFQRRDRLVGLLWPELDQEHARTALRKAIHLARSVLGKSAMRNRGDEELCLSPDVVWCDVIELQSAAERGHLGRVVELYRDDLMPGFHLAGCHDFDAWLAERRTALLEIAVAASWALAQHLEADSQRTEAAKYARHTARLASTNERALRRSLVMLDRLGDRAGAISLYEETARRLRKELEVEPSPETVRMAEALRAGRPLA